MSTPDPKTLAAEASTAYQEADFANAARLFGAAASAFVAAGNTLEAAEMQNNQSVASLMGQDAQGAWEAARGTAATFLAAGDARRAGMAFSNEASALEALKRLPEAIAVYRQAAAELEKAGEEQLRASVMQALAGMQLRQGKLFEAILSLRLGVMDLKTPTLKQKILRSLLRLIKT